MSYILITDLNGQGPGDILGAIGAETDIDPGVIGNIEIHDLQALVEVEVDKSKELARQLDGQRVGRSEVSVMEVSEEEVAEKEAVNDYVEHFKHLVELEREEEMQQHEESIRKLTGRQRQQEGEAILHLRGRDEGKALEGQLVKFMRKNKGEPLPDTKISVGDLVMLSRKDPFRDDNPTGTVAQKTNYSITAAFDNPQSFIFGKDLRMDLYVNDITYQRMKEALEKLRNPVGKLSGLRNILAGIEAPAETDKAEVSQWFNEELNNSQKEAVAYSLGSRDFHLIHGPPGTGKTTTAIEVIEQAITGGQQVLATAASNTAVDNILEFLLNRGSEAVRVGHPARVTPLLREYTLDSLVKENEKYQLSEKLREQAFEKKDEQEQYTHPSGKYRRGMSNSRIKQLAGQNKGSRGVSPEKIRDMARWLEVQDEVDRLFEQADAFRDEAVNEILNQVEVVCTTNSTAGSELMDDRNFDLIVIDEATQATEPGCLIPITHGKKVVMAGDHKQLPPTVRNLEAAKKGLENTLFERLAETFPAIKRMLNVQYRMHEDIMAFPSREFYDESLTAHESVKEHTLADFELDTNTSVTGASAILDPTEPVVFADTADLGAEERTRMGSTSKENPEEARLVAKLVESLLESGMRPEEIAVISPYNDQVDLLQQKIEAEDLEINSVDGFQGREKEAVLISLTRSNPDNNIGFLEDVRRLNVSLTRARRKLIVVGDSSTVTAHESYRHFVDYVRENGRVVEVS